jgi:hypothetical protein
MKAARKLGLFDGGEDGIDKRTRKLHFFVSRGDGI